ncbi:divergent polysaccharide deacetylase family protein [Fulvimarina sp. 2208YS6-2-32]|uniref:Divergent polysaccharide deacetylase family protein n=1 Tax=Fulvimarina uroteuthidis TaxID=3098149 RepID=A0ABU5I7D5_9HYPH|nr:divergent polysaccharide deacetylase family protein [Fulvimarina sp. 2208YS6-2-32]MDY8110106.1 divergent polysaccharide deacetylase family protein [Fulvimarina sp. 2208YS6-2-32]
MDSTFSQPLKPRDRSTRRTLKPTRGDAAVAVAATVLVVLSLYPAWFDRAHRPGVEPIADLETAGRGDLDPVATNGITTLGGAAKKIDIDAALADRARQAASDAPYRPASVTVMEIDDVRQASLVAHMPESGLIEQSDFGPLPVRSADGRRPFDVYRAAGPTRMGPRVAIVVGGLGISQSGTQSAIQTLPSEITLAFAANGNSLDRWMQEARRSGHELLLQAPMEPVGYPNVDPGENTVTVDQMMAQDHSSLHATLGQMTNYIGVMNYLGGKITADAAAMQPLMSELTQRGLMYLDDGSSMRSVAPSLAQMTGTPLGAADLVLDDVQDAGEIGRRLDQLEQIARSKGSAIGVASAFETTTKVIGGWVRQAEQRGITLVPVSAVVTDPEQR